VALLGISTLLAWTLQNFGGELNFEFGNVSFQCGDGTGNVTCNGDAVVYRISFIMTVFFAVMFLGTMNVPTCTGDRKWRPLLGEGFHSGFWAFKLLAYVGFIVASFFMPASMFSNDGYIWVARIVSVFFLIFQVLSLVDFGYQMNEDWVSRAYDGENVQKGWAIGVIVIALILNLLSVSGIVLLFVHYSACKEAMIFTSITLIAYVVYTAITLFREQLIGEPGAILPASVVSIYSTYLVWSASESIQNDENCEPYSDDSNGLVLVGILFATIALMWTAYSASRRIEMLLQGDTKIPEDHEQQQNQVAGIYAVGQDENGKEILARDLGGYESSSLVVADGNNRNDKLEDKAWLFHFMMVTASMYMSMLLTNWGVSSDVDSGKASMWIKIIAQWFTISLFFWTLVAPKLCFARSFE